MLGLEIASLILAFVGVLASSIVIYFWGKISENFRDKYPEEGPQFRMPPSTHRDTIASSSKIWCNFTKRGRAPVP
jgi:hypothetical protein